MTSLKRDKYRASGGKMLDENDSVFDLTAWIKSVGVSILTAFKIKNVAGVEINPATKEDQDDIESNQTDGSQKTQIVTDGDVVDAHNPLPCDGDSVYTKDVWVEQSDIGDFSGVITDLFDNLHTVITNTTANNPKEITIHFNRTIPVLVIGLGAFTGNFSNVKIIGIVSGHVETTIFDESSDNTNKTSLTAFTPSAGFNAIKIQFHTADTVSLSNIFILKATTTLSRIQGQKPDGEFTEFQSTQSGNFKMSLEEVDGQLKDDMTGVMNVIDYEHHEIHGGGHFLICGFETVANNVEIDFTVQTPDTDKWLHMLFDIEGSSQTEFYVYEITDADEDGSLATPINNNRNSVNTSDAVIRKNPTINSVGNLIFSQSKGLAGTTPARASSEGIVERTNELVLKQNTKYLFRIKSKEDGNIISYCGEWYEHTNV